MVLLKLSMDLKKFFYSYNFLFSIVGSAGCRLPVGFSLAVVSRCYFLLAVLGFLICAGFSGCRAQALGHELSSCGEGSYLPQCT